MTVERIDYQAGNVKAKGALVWNEKISGKRPLMLVMTNWLGVTDLAIKRAQKMAGDKYVAFVGCMYGEGKTCEGPPTSAEWMMAVRADRVERDIVEYAQLSQSVLALTKIIAEGVTQVKKVPDAPSISG